MSKENYYKQEYIKKDGTKGVKTFTDDSKSASRLGTEARDWCKSKGYKPTLGSAGTRHI